MNPFTALQHQPPALHSIQLLLVGVFLASYVAAVAGLLEPRGRLRAAALAAAAGLGMGFVFTPWTLGALIAVGSVGAVGLFIGTSWLLSRALGVHDQATTMLPEFDGEFEAGEAPAPAPRQPVTATRGHFGAPTAPAPLS